LNPRPFDFLRLHLIVLLWGFTAVLGKLISVPSVEMVFYRTLLASLGMAALLVIRRTSFDVGATDAFKLVMTGFIVSAHWITFFGSGQVANASVSLVGFATGSLWTALLDPVMNRRKISRLEVFFALAVFAGLAVIASFNFRYPMGLLLGVVSGLTSAVFFVLNGRFRTRLEPNQITFYEMSGAFIGTALFLPVYRLLWAEKGALNMEPTAGDWVYIGILALVCSVYAYSESVRLMKKFSVFMIQLTLNLEPVYGMALAVLILGSKELMTINFYWGTAIILAAVLFYPVARRKQETSASYLR
jgi:drug/metabolite transporter (DMT)-like permease